MASKCIGIELLAELDSTVLCLQLLGVVQENPFAKITQDQVVGYIAAKHRFNRVASFAHVLRCPNKHGSPSFRSESSVAVLKLCVALLCDIVSTYPQDRRTKSQTALADTTRESSVAKSAVPT
jgi:hypothetical protein